jgi:hypothetical protein
VLYLASVGGYEQEMQWLLEKGANVAAKDARYGWTALFEVARYGHEATTQCSFTYVEYKD